MRSKVVGIQRIQHQEGKCARFGPYERFTPIVFPTTQKKSESNTDARLEIVQSIKRVAYGPGNVDQFLFNLPVIQQNSP
jgi:hypothetical protein